MFVVKWYFIQYQSRSLLFYPPMWSYTSCFSVCLKVTKNGIAWMKPWDTQRRKNKVSHSQTDCGENCFMAGGLYKVPINLQNVTWAQQPQLGNSIAMFKSVWGGVMVIFWLQFFIVQLFHLFCTLWSCPWCLFRKQDTCGWSCQNQSSHNNSVAFGLHSVWTHRV